jgi:hypothetical protein
MPQLSLYLDDATMTIVQGRARSEQLSVSKYVADVLRNHADANWPSDFWELCGSVVDSTFEAPTRTPVATDVPRESL